MPTLTRPNYPAFPSALPQIPPSQRSGSDPDLSEAWDYGFKRHVNLPQSPPVGAGILAITFFFLIIFFSDVLLAHISSRTLGIAITLSTFGLMALILLILFLF